MMESSTIVALAATALLWIASQAATAQSPRYVEDSASPVIITASAPVGHAYLRPTEKTRIVNYLFDSFGPYPMVGAGLSAGIDQIENAPPEWGGATGFGKRLGSEFGTAAIGTTTRYALAEVFREDTLYYRCECRGVLPRMSHAVNSTFTARRGADGHRAFSISALAAPYAGAAASVYGWYPDRFGPKDALRIGSYNLLFYMGGNISLEFLSSGSHSLLSRMHINDMHSKPEHGPNR